MYGVVDDGDDDKQEGMVHKSPTCFAFAWFDSQVTTVN